MMKGLLYFFIRCFKTDKKNDREEMQDVKYYEIEREQFDFSFGPGTNRDEENNIQDNPSESN
jgi:hypothetical protein